MRVKIGNRIYLCTTVTHSKDSRLLLLTTSNGVYTVDMLSEENAVAHFHTLLLSGYDDVSNYEYSN